MRYLIPLSGDSEAMFPRAEFHFPKPLVEIAGVPMIVRVIENIRAHDHDAEFVFVVRNEDCVQFSLDAVLGFACHDKCKILRLDRPTAGAACSALLAIEHINDDRPLVVCNGDQILDCDLKAILSHFNAGAFDAGVITFPSVHPRWSYVRIDDQNLVMETAEKKVISQRAIAGFYYFRRGDKFVEATLDAIRNSRSVDGVYYVAPVLNEILLSGGRIGYRDIPHECYHSLYSPQRLDLFEREYVASTARSQGKRVTIVIPMAGLGSRFAKAGYERPKPFIDVAGAAMIDRVMENLSVPSAKFVLLARSEHIAEEAETCAALRARGNVEFVPVDRVTEGAACTVLLARQNLSPEEPLLIANCDQIVDFDCREFIADCERRGLDGSILVFRDPKRDKKWSFARLDADDLVAETREKEPISDLATVGLYYFSKAKYFTGSAIDMIVRQDRSNNEYYVCPVYNYLIEAGGRVGVFEIAENAMHGIGTPEDLQSFLKLRYAQ